MSWFFGGRQWGSPILTELQSFGYSYQRAKQCIEANKHNDVTTAYYLLLRKKHIKGKYSKSDINSKCFDKNLIVPNKRKKK